MNKYQLLDLIIDVVSLNKLSVISNFNTIEVILRDQYKIDCSAHKIDDKCVQFYCSNGNKSDIYLNLNDSLVAAIRRKKFSKL